MPAEVRFAAMGTSAQVSVLGGPSSLARRAAARVTDLDRRWSRFRPGSELSRLNDGPRDAPVTVSADTYRLVERAVDAWHRTAGRYDPTVLDAVRANGYDRTLTAIPPDRTLPDVGIRAAPGCAAIVLDGTRHTVDLPGGVSLDPGGIGKGLAADLVAEEAMAQGAEGVLVDLGGDVRVAGTGPVAGAWIIDVEHPHAADTSPPLLHLAMRDAGIATSSRLRRRWRVNGEPRHHLVDPRNGRPLTGALVAATVVATVAWWAEVQAKAVLVAGTLDVINDASAVAVDSTGGITATLDLRELLS